jgi:putative PIN family toxin of toxin-antitoxin system
VQIVIDSNVWISALVFGGKPRQLFSLAITEGWDIVISEEIMTEVRRTLTRKFPDFLDDFVRFQFIMQPRLSKVALGTVRIKASRDKDDDMIIETAVLGQVSHIITGDNDLLVLSHYKSILIIRPADFIEKVTGKKA